MQYYKYRFIVFFQVLSRLFVSVCVGAWALWLIEKLATLFTLFTFLSSRNSAKEQEKQESCADEQRLRNLCCQTNWRTPAHGHNAKNKNSNTKKHENKSKNMKTRQTEIQTGT